jgi:signal transduction histidine kinase
MWFAARLRGNTSLLFAAGLALATGLTFWFGWQATLEWQRSTATAANTRGNEVVTLLAVAFERDMKGAQLSVLLPLNEEVMAMSSYDLADRFARGFARFPYLESFFVWTSPGAGDGFSRPGNEVSADGTTWVFNRADRTPPWDDGETRGDPYPVVFRRDPMPLWDVVQLARAQAARSSRFIVFDTIVSGTRYQTVAHLMYDGIGPNARLFAVVGFLVNLPWVREHYFGDFVQQMQSIIGDTSLTIDIISDAGNTVAAVGPPADSAPAHVRSFPLIFADRALLAEGLRGRVPLWQARVGVANEASRVAMSRSATRTLGLLGVGAVATLIGLAFSVRAARRAADLAAVQSEFVSAVSHEMKTPLSLIKLASDTLANRRYADPNAIADYGKLMGVEAQHLARLIDNVLCYARITDPALNYDTEVLDVAELVQESVDRFRPQLAALEFDVRLNLPVDAPAIRGDHLMLSQVLDNLIDNAEKHSASGKYLAVTVRPGERTVDIEVADHGEGIPSEDLRKVFDKFYRRKGAKSRGAGLGLAIVRRIVEDHRGTVRMHSTPGQGTSVVITLPVVSA